MRKKCCISANFKKFAYHSYSSMGKLSTIGFMRTFCCISAYFKKVAYHSCSSMGKLSTFGLMRTFCCISANFKKVAYHSCSSMGKLCTFGLMRTFCCISANFKKVAYHSCSSISKPSTFGLVFTCPWFTWWNELATTKRRLFFHLLLVPPFQKEKKNTHLTLGPPPLMVLTYVWCNDIWGHAQLASRLTISCTYFYLKSAINKGLENIVMYQTWYLGQFHDVCSHLRIGITTC